MMRDLPHVPRQNPDTFPAHSEMLELSSPHTLEVLA